MTEYYKNMCFFFKQHLIPVASIVYEKILLFIIELLTHIWRTQKCIMGVTHFPYNRNTYNSRVIHQGTLFDFDSIFYTLVFPLWKTNYHITYTVQEMNAVQLWPYRKLAFKSNEHFKLHPVLFIWIMKKLSTVNIGFSKNWSPTFENRFIFNLLPIDDTVTIWEQIWILSHKI